MKEICIKADKNNIEEVFSFVEGELAATEGISRKDVLKLHMIVDEIFANISDYAYGDTKGDVKVSYEYDSESDTVTITFTDEGVPYNPLSAETPDITLSAKERKAGGLGLFMVKNTVDDIRYETADGKNILILTKIVGGEGNHV